MLHTFASGAIRRLCLGLITVNYVENSVAAMLVFEVIECRFVVSVTNLGGDLDRSLATASTNVCTRMYAYVKNMGTFRSTVPNRPGSISISYRNK